MKLRPPTREGWWFLIAALAVGAIAVDAGVNLFFLAFGMMVCLIGAGFALAQVDLAGLRMRRVLPPSVFAGTPYLMGIVLENTKRRLPSFSIEVEDLVEGRPIDKRCYFLKLPPGRSQETAYRHTSPRRGLHRLTGFRLATKFPFGFFPRGRLVADSQELCVYPALLPPSEAMLRGLPARPGAGADRGRSRQGEFAGLRAFRPGDDPRDIHWRSSARRGLTLMREHEDETARETTVVLDDSPGTRARPEAYERAISEAAGLCVELGRRGFSVALRTRDGVVPPGYGPTHTARLLRVLALLPASP